MGGTVAGAVGVAFLVALIPVLVRFAVGWGLLDVPNACRMTEHLVPSFHAEPSPIGASS